MGFPRFTGAVRNIVISCVAIYVVLLLIAAFAPLRYIVTIHDYAILQPDHIRQGWVWQFLTYGFIQGSPFNCLMAMLGIYFIGSAVEDRIRSRAFYELFFVSLIGAGILGFLLSFSGRIALGGAFGSGPAANAILMVFFLLYRDAPIMLFPIPIPIPVKYIVIFAAAVQGAYLLLSHFALFYCVQLLGMGVGYLWYRFAFRHSLLGAIQDWSASTRNNYYRWKRRRAARKFQVYMKKHQDEPVQYFDEYGNFKPPDERDKKKDKGQGQGGPGGWVN